MLDAYIIDRIEREQHERQPQPVLHIPAPEPPREEREERDGRKEDREDQEDREDRNPYEVDFSL